MVDGRSAVSRRKMVMYFLIDCSNSMNENGKMAALNNAMREAIDVAQDLDAKNTTVQIEVAILMFGVGADGMQCKWLYGEPEPVDRFEWVDQIAEGWTPLAKALNMMNDSMSRDKFLDAPSASVAPVVVVMSDGVPCTASNSVMGDMEETRSAIAALNNNGWFKRAIKTAIAIGDDADRNLLTEITGTSDTVFDVHDARNLESKIKFIVLRSSMIQTKLAGSTPSNTNNENTAAQEQFIEDAAEEKKQTQNSSEFNTSGWHT